MSYDYPDGYGSAGSASRPPSMRRMPQRFTRSLLASSAHHSTNRHHLSPSQRRSDHGGAGGGTLDRALTDNQVKKLMGDISNHAELARMADEAPLELLALIESGCLAPEDLTFAAESAGDIKDRAAAIPVLLGLIGHRSALVREGMVYGLTKDVSRDMNVRSAICSLADHDVSPGVREAAIEALNSD